MKDGLNRLLNSGNLNDEAGPHRDVEDELETDEERMKRTERDMRRKAQKRVHKEKGRDD